MSVTLLNVSQRRELSLYGEAAADVAAALEELGIRGIIVGAFARDLHLHYGAGIPVQRVTEDLDFALAVRNWKEFDDLRARLLKSGKFQAVAQLPHRLRHRSSIPVDLLPFGKIESTGRTIAWPPQGDVVMDVFGFREALTTAQEVLLPGGAAIEIVALAALALLKLVVWADRHQRSPGKDAADIMFIVAHYLNMPGNKDRLWSEFIEWTHEESFDLDHSAGRMLGRDMQRILDERGLTRISGILRAEILEHEFGELTLEMAPRSPRRAQLLLRGLFDGLTGR